MIRDFPSYFSIKTESTVLKKHLPSSVPVFVDVCRDPNADPNGGH